MGVEKLMDCVKLHLSQYLTGYLRLATGLFAAITVAAVAIEDGQPIPKPATEELQTGGVTHTTAYRCVYGHTEEICTYVLTVPALSLIFTVATIFIDHAGRNGVRNIKAFFHERELPHLVNRKPSSGEFLYRLFSWSTWIVDGVFAALWFVSSVLQFLKADFSDSYIEVAAAFSFLNFLAFAVLVILRCFCCRETVFLPNCRRIEVVSRPSDNASLHPGSSESSAAATADAVTQGKQPHSLLLVDAEVLLGLASLVLSVVVLSSITDDGDYTPKFHTIFSNSSDTLRAPTVNATPQESGENSCIFGGDRAACNLTIIASSAVLLLSFAPIVLMVLRQKDWLSTVTIRRIDLVQLVACILVLELWIVVFAYTSWRWSQVDTDTKDLMTQQQRNAAVAAQVCACLNAIVWFLITCRRWSSLHRLLSTIANKHFAEPKCSYQRYCWNFLQNMCEGHIKSDDFYRLFHRPPGQEVCFCSNCSPHLNISTQVSEAGGEKYEEPSSCSGFNVNTEMMLCRAGILLPDRGEETKNWPIAYHGTPVKNCVSILKDGKICAAGELSRTSGKMISTRQGHVNDATRPADGENPNQVFLTPSFKNAKNYAGDSSPYKDKSTGKLFEDVRVVLQVRLRPRSFTKARQTRQMLAEEEQSERRLFLPRSPIPADKVEWCVPFSDDVIVDAVLVSMRQSP